MTTITRTVTMIRTGQFKRVLSDWFEEKLANAVRWLLSKRAVQEQIASTFAGETPMCRVLSHAIESALDSHTVDADNIEGLGRFVEDSCETALKDFTVQADDVEGLEQFVTEGVEQLLEDDTRVTKLVDAVCETIAARIIRG